jgi:hypothetical protein
VGGVIAAGNACENEPKRVTGSTLFFIFREPRSFLQRGQADDTNRFSSKGRSGVRGKADIERCFIVGRGNMGVLLRPKRHAGMPLEQFGVFDPDCFQGEDNHPDGVGEIAIAFGPK